MRCAACGTENRVDRKFCAQCGAALARACPNCGAANLPGERFCGECGRALDEATAPSDAVSPPAATAGPGLGAAAGPSAERRLVSVLFADLVGFTARSESSDPETVRELLGSYFETARGVIERYGGTIEKFIGDAVMAVWGAPTAHEDDAERAVRAALDLVDAVAALDVRDAAERTAGLAARAAVLTGEAAVTLGAVGQGLVAGDLVNSAARLQSVAAPGTVLVGEGTERSTRDSIAYEPAGDHIVKGKQAPLAAWRAMRVVAGRRGTGRSDRLEAPFVGRVAELRALKDALAATGTERRARYVAITGQAGIGKSRLAWEFENYVDGLVEPVYWHRGRSPAYGEGIAFWALAEMVRGRARVAETDPPDQAGAKLATMLEQYVTDPEDRRWIEPHLRVLLGLEESAGGDRNEQFAAWRRLFEEIAGRGTTALVFEDLQWADDGLLDFIDSLFDWSRSRTLLIVALARPELLERRPTLGQASRNALSLHLEPLSDEAMGELLAGLAPDLGPDLVASVVARAEGVPLYAIELVRMLRGAGEGERTSGSERLAIPPSLQALVAARLDGLAGADRALLQDAAVLGHSFTLAGLAAVSGDDPAVLDGRLAPLVRREFLTRDVDPRSPERGQYAFVQSVVHEVAYGTLARRDRRARHLAAARYFETLEDESVATVLATHYLEAYRAAPDDEQGRTIRAQARVALRAAADRSARLHNYDQAIRDLERALELSDEAAERAALLVRQAELAEAGARLDEAFGIAERARDAYRALGDEPRSRQATALLGRIEMKRGRIDAAADLLEAGLADLDPAADPPAYARMASEYARIHMQRDDVGEGAAWAERALEAAAPSRLVEVIAEALNTRGVCLQGLGRLDEGVALIRASVELAAEHHLAHAELRARFNLAGRRWADDPRDAIAIMSGGLDVATRTGRLDWQIANADFLAGMYVSVGDFDRALETLAVVRDEARPAAELADATLTRAEVAAYRGQPGWATALSAVTAMLPEESRGTQRTWNWAVANTVVAIAQGRLAEARLEAEKIGGNWAFWSSAFSARAALRSRDLEAARTAVASPALRDELGAVNDVYRIGLGAGVLALEGRRDEAIRGYREAVREFRRLDVPMAAGDLLLDAAWTLDRDDPERTELAKEARAIWESLGARAQLDRLDEAMRRTDAGAPARPVTAVDRARIATADEAASL